MDTAIIIYEFKPEMIQIPNIFYFQLLCEYDIFPFQNSLGRKNFLNVLIQEHFYHKLRPIFDMTICQPPWNQQLMDFYIQVRIGG